MTSRTSIIPTPCVRCEQWNTYGPSTGRFAARSSAAYCASAGGRLQLRVSFVAGQRTGSMQLMGHIHSAKLTYVAASACRYHGVPGAPGSVQWEGIMTNITASKLAQLEVTNSRAGLAELTAHIEEVKEQERTRIAREIHDDLGGNLTAIKMALAMLSKRLPPDQPQLADKAAYVDALVDRTIEAVHRISLDLRPSMLDFGIVAALEWQVKEFEKQMGVACTFSSNEKEIDLAADHASALFRIFQEALTNIAKHARATRVTVILQRLRHHIALKIADNGGGIAPADRIKPGSFGLRGMSERALALGGTLALSRAPGGGTIVTIKIKLSPPGTDSHQ